MLSPLSKTSLVNVSRYKRDYKIIDATSLILGRLAATIAHLLMGKHKPCYAPHMDLGDGIIVINADKILLKGNKMDINKGKIYYRHTGYPGGIKTTTAGRILAGPHPERVIKKAVFGMLTRNTLNAQRMKHLYVYAGPNHPHASQKPEILDVARMSRKNSASTASISASD